MKIHSSKLLVAAITLIPAISGFAAEFVLESFDGTSGSPINGTGSGNGWSGTWSGPNAATFGPGNSFIASGENAIGISNSSAASCALSGGADLTRALDTVYTVGDDALNGEIPVIYLSFLVENQGPIFSGHEYRTSLLSAGVPIISFGKRINRPWTLFDSDEENNVTGNTGNTNLGTWFAVVKLEYDGTDTIATGYLAEEADSDLDLTDTSTYLRTTSVTLIGKASFDGVLINSHNTTSARIDEVRIGDDLSNVITTPDPLLTISPSTTTDTTNIATAISLPITNAGLTEDLVITAITPAPLDGASIQIDSALPITLAAGESGMIDLTFSPGGVGTVTTSISISSNDAANPVQSAELIFNVQDPIISVSENSLDFGILPANSEPQTLSLTVENTGSTEDLTISALTFTGDTQFTVGELPASIPAGGNVDIDITLTPAGLDGFFNGVLNIESNDFNLTIPQITLLGFVTPSNTIAATFDLDPDQASGAIIDLDDSEMATWITSELIDEATGTGALGADNQNGANRFFTTGNTGNLILFSSNRESDAQTPLQEGGNNESTWTTFSMSPAPGAGSLGFNGAEAVVQTFAFNDINGSNQTNWTLYYSTDNKSTWTSLGTLAGAGIEAIGFSPPVQLRWDLTPIGTRSSTVDFILDPVATGANNGTAAQRSTGFDNFYVTLGITNELVISSIEAQGEGTVTLNWTGNPGLYLVEYSLDLTQDSWLELSDNAEITAGSTTGSEILSLPASVTDRSHAFYRIRQAP